MPSTEETLRDALADRYRLEKQIGQGGMATVFLARDLRYDRDVALKVLRPELAQSLGAERFTREIRVAARLQHPHILTVLDSGEVAGILWFTMPFVRGESLRGRLQRERRLPVEDAVRIAREVADALGHAHREGIVHRDIKPENILLSEGHALVADFGIARALAPSDAPGSHASPDSLTGTGLAVGTPAYMSPEQATGDRSVDARTDVYALGAVTYEMLAGEPPHTGPTPQAVIARMMTEAPRAITVVRPAVSAEVDAVVRRALARDAVDRWPTAAEFAAALDRASRVSPTTEAASTAERASGGGGRRVGAGVLFILGLLLGGGALFAWMQSDRPAAAGTSAVKRIAVLPFANEGSPDDQYFADGMTDEIRGKLAGLPGLQVTASQSAATYKGTTKTPQEIAQELGVDYLLVGKVRWVKVAGQPSRVRVSPELISASAGTIEWQQPFDASLTDVFQVQADVAGKVASALDVALSPTQAQQLGARPTGNLQAYDAYLRGNELNPLAGATPSVEVRRAIGHFERAVALDSTFAPAWAQLSRSLSALAYLGTASPAERDLALQAAERATALDPKLGNASAALGDYHYRVRNDVRSALRYYTQARELAPQEADLLLTFARVQQSAGAFDSSAALLRRAESLDPRSVAVSRAIAFNLLWLRRYPEALQAADRAVQLSPLSPGAYQSRAMVRLAQGDLEGARRVMRSVPAEVDPTALVTYIALYWDLYWVLDDSQQSLLLRLPLSAYDDDVLGRSLAHAYVWEMRGDTARMRAAASEGLADAAQRVRSSPDDPYQLVLHAVTLAYAGRSDDAVRLAERAVAIQGIEEDGYNGPYNEHLAARVYLRVGQHEKAIDILERLLKVPYFLSPDWLRIDPLFRPLRGNPRFERLTRAN